MDVYRGTDRCRKTEGNLTVTVDQATTFLDALVEAIKTAGSYNKSDQVPPAVVLWPDRDRQWEPLLPLLRARLPVLTLGDYARPSGPGQPTGFAA